MMILHLVCLRRVVLEEEEKLPKLTISERRCLQKSGENLKKLRQKLRQKLRKTHHKLLLNNTSSIYSSILNEERL